MFLIQVFLPLKDNAGKPFPRNEFSAVRETLLSRFGGLTAFTRAPAEGLWKPGRKKAKRDEIVIFEVTAARLQKRWWRKYRQDLEARFRQETILILSQAVEKL